MKMIKLVAELPAKELSDIIGLIESSGGAVNEIQYAHYSKKGENRKRKTMLTRKIVRDVLDFVKKHPQWTHGRIGLKFNLSGASVSRILTGKAAIQKK